MDTLDKENGKNARNKNRSLFSRPHSPLKSEKPQPSKPKNQNPYVDFIQIQQLINAWNQRNSTLEIKIKELQELLTLLQQECSLRFQNTVKVPVLLARVDVNIEVEKEMIIPYPIKGVREVEWEIDNLTCQTQALHNKLVVEGQLKANVHYDTLFRPYTTLAISSEVPFRKYVDLTFLSPPTPPKQSQKKEFSFQTGMEVETYTHSEKILPLNDQFMYDLREMAIVSADMMEQKGNKTSIFLQATATYSIDLLQRQYVGNKNTCL